MLARGTQVRIPSMAVSYTCSTDVSRLSAFGVNTKIGAGQDPWGKMIRLIENYFLLFSLKLVKFKATQCEFFKHLIRTIRNEAFVLMGQTKNQVGCSVSTGVMFLLAISSFGLIRNSDTNLCTHVV